VSVVVLDFGSQYTRLIARRLRELHALSVILPGGASAERIRAAQPEALILSGGPESVGVRGAPRPTAEIYTLGVPILGICYGMHLLVERFGGTVVSASPREYGRAALTARSGPLFTGIERESQVWMSHADSVTILPEGWARIAATAENPAAAVASVDGRFTGVQFHPEVSHTPQGTRLLANFLEQAEVQRDWTPENVLDRLTSETGSRVGTERALLAVSGGVDSSSLALLLARAGVTHTGVFVDHGLLRAGEREEVTAALRSVGVNLEVVEAQDRFFSALAGVTDPEEKRRIIGREFIRVFEEQARIHGPFRFLAQGTLYPDVIESAGGEGAANIKSHHNVGGLPQRLGFELLEPFRLLFKDEVRELARLLGLPDAIRLRHPFPGPGLGIRVLGEVTKEHVDIVRRADALFIAALRDSGWYEKVWQALAVLIPARSVGVAGDSRRYGTVIALRAVTSVDGMTADWARLPAGLLETVSQRITREVPEVGRVVYDTTSKPPATIEWE
jgi:GMP synthase (glutamine-hydrolysing)